MTPVFTPQNILVTGGAGFIGANFIHYMLAKYPDITITNVDALTYAGNLDYLHDIEAKERYQFVQADINNHALIKTLLKDNEINCIVHFAAESHVDRSISGPAAFIQTNLVGTFSLLEAAREVWLQDNHWDASQCRFHHISTDEVYGTLDIGAPAFTEKNPYEPNSPYSASKAGSDHLVRAYQHTYQLPTTMSNCSNNYGPYQHPEKFIPTIIRACLNKSKIPVYGDGSNRRDWLYVLDHCIALDDILRLAKTGEYYNVGGNNEQVNLDVVKMICELFDARYSEHAPHANLIEFVTDRPGHDWRYAIDSSKLKKDLGWQAAQSFKDGLNLTLDYFIEFFSKKSKGE